MSNAMNAVEFSKFKRTYRSRLSDEQMYSLMRAWIGDVRDLNDEPYWASSGYRWAVRPRNSREANA